MGYSSVVNLIFSRMTALALTLAACSCSTSPTLPAGSPIRLDPIAFFTGRTHGEGRLDKLFSSPVTISVEGVGRRAGDTFILDQTISDSGKSPHVRRWTMRPISPGHYSGSLTDASGPVQFTVAGPRAFIRYTMKGGLKVEQQLALQSDGNTILNRLEVHKFGVRVATLNETIRKFH